MEIAGASRRLKDLRTMEYSITKAQIENDILFETLKALYGGFAALGLPLYIVGGTARDFSRAILDTEKPARTTTDLDVAIAIRDWHVFDEITSELESRQFRKGRDKQKFIYYGLGGNIECEVDVVPFGEVAENEIVGWPPDSNPQMSVKCFEDVMGEADIVTVNGEFCVFMAPLSGQFLIKLDAWNDRHIKTDKDAYDMLFIMSNFYIAFITRKVPCPKEVEVPEDDSLFDTTVWGARWIACELSRFLSEKHRRFYYELIMSELRCEESSCLVRDMVKYCRERNAYQIIRHALEDFALILGGNNQI